MLYNKNYGLAEGLERSVKMAILMATAFPSPLLASFLEGTEKVLVIHYNGDWQGRTFDPQRKDGMVSLLYPDHEFYRLPPSHDPLDGRASIRAGVPLWLLRPCSEEALVLGVGKLHPLWNAATIDFYDPDTRLHLGQKFFGDPRINFNDPPEGCLDLDELQREIAAAGGAVSPPPLLAPRYPEFISISELECME